MPTEADQFSFLFLSPKLGHLVIFDSDLSAHNDFLLYFYFHCQKVVIGALITVQLVTEFCDKCERSYDYLL